MRRLLCILLISLWASGCATRPPAERPDPVASQLEAGERITLRIPAELMHGHDMTEQSYDSPEGYASIPTYRGELALTDRRLLFVAKSAGEPSWLSIPYGEVARFRPSRTTLLHYLVVWDREGHPDSFVVDASNVAALHRHFALAMAALIKGGSHPASPLAPVN